MGVLDQAAGKRQGLQLADGGVKGLDITLTREDDDSEDEQRFVSIGLDTLNRILVVVYTYRGADIRLISARRATSKERKYYEEGI